MSPMSKGAGAGVGAPMSGGIPSMLAPASGNGNAAKLVEYVAERKAYQSEIGELGVTCNALREELRGKEESIVEERR